MKPELTQLFMDCLWWHILAGAYVEENWSYTEPEFRETERETLGSQNTL